MKIVLLSCHSGLVFRGAETVCDALATQWSARHEVTVFQPKKFEADRPYRIMEIPGGVGDRRGRRSVLKYLRLDRMHRRMLFFAVRAIWKCVFLRPDIILPINGGWVTLLAKVYARLSGAKLVVRGGAGVYPEPLTVRVRPDLFICTSAPNERVVRRLAPRQKTVVVPNGVDLERFAPVPKAHSGGLPRPVILCAASHDRYKNVPETIQAVARMKDASLLVLGGSPETQELGARLLGARFRQTKVPHDQMPAVYNTADLFTLVSESSEAFGVVYLEAMACNLPVVATDDELRRGIVGSAGLFVKDPRNPADYADMLQRALATNWGEAPRRQAEKFSWHEVAARYEQAMAALSG